MQWNAIIGAVAGCVVLFMFISMSSFKPASEIKLETDKPHRTGSLPLFEYTPAGTENLVVLTSASGHYLDMVQNFACNMQVLGIPFQIAALDTQILEYGKKAGWNIYFDEELSSRPEDCSYGTLCFKQLTKTKSARVLRLLKEGKDVLFTDPDVIWMKDVRSELFGLSQTAFADLVIQSDEAERNGLNGVSTNKQAWLNSGFYLVKSTPWSIEAFSDIVKHSSTSTNSEQGSFFQVLCQPPLGSRRTPDLCTYKNRDILLLNLDLYPNGGWAKAIWETSDVASSMSTAHPDVRILHNNWIKGGNAKMARQVSTGFIFYDSEARACKNPLK